VPSYSTKEGTNVKFSEKKGHMRDVKYSETYENTEICNTSI
jgi:hypothetical protein